MSLSKRERLLVALPTVIIGIMLITEPISAFAEYLAMADSSLLSRKMELKSIQHISRRYKSLSSRLTTLRNSYAQKELSLEEVYNKLDKIVQDSIGSNNYELKRKEVVQSSSVDYEQHNFQLTIKTLTLNELVKLLFKLEQRDEPLFLRKVSVISRPKGKFQATLLLYSIQSSST